MRYYVYFDGYGHPKRVINENELAEKYDSDPQQFLKAACGLEPGARIEDTTGHVGTLTFDSEKERCKCSGHAGRLCIIPK
ncbi:MAG: hypothetical protein JRI79_13330 [Deltaproteobacteria bacterium]|nr:hypothetical protein [Deltaproteobacteria bacterium]